LLTPEILVKYTQSSDEETQSTALKWISEFITIAPPELLKYVTNLLIAILPALSSTTPQASLAVDANRKLYELVSGSGTQVDQSAVSALFQIFKDEREECRIGTLDWLIMIQSKSPDLINTDGALHKDLMSTLSEYSEDVAKRSLKLLASISNSSYPQHFDWFMRDLLNLFAADKRLLETRGTLAIRNLCNYLDAGLND
jgi:vacuole morphology and inheritance protein 14